MESKLTVSYISTWYRWTVAWLASRALIPTSIVVSLSLACGICLSQQPIRVNSSLVDFAFVARDTHRNVLNDLTKDDIDVLEDGVNQNIVFFARSVDVPLTLGLIVDNSPSQESVTKQHEHDLEEFLRDVLGPRDRAFLVCFDNHIRLVSDFTQSRKELMERMKRYHSDKPEAVTVPELGSPEDRDLGTAFYDAIYNSIYNKLARESGRRALLVFSDGEDNSSSHNMLASIEAAQNADVLIFTIRYTQDNFGKLTARNKYGISVMDRVAQETGGVPFDAMAAGPDSYFKQIAQELRASYEVGYYPTDSSKDGTFRKVVIRPKKAGIKLRSRPGYYAR